jgi:hypothetical protein
LASLIEVYKCYLKLFYRNAIENIG